MPQSVARAVREVLSGLTFLNYAFEKKLVNDSALARVIRPSVEEKLGKQVSLGSVVAAVRRFLESFKSSSREKNFFALLKSSKPRLRTGLAEIHFNRTLKTFEKLSAFANKINWAQGEKMYVLQRSEEITVIVDKDHLKEILACAPKKDLLSASKDRAVITITYDPKAFAESVGGLHFYTGQFASHGIGIYLMFSTYSATSFVIREQDAALAYKSLSSSLGEIAGVYGEGKE